LSNHVVKDKDAHAEAQQEKGWYNNGGSGKMENVKVLLKTASLPFTFLHLAQKVSESI